MLQSKHALERHRFFPYIAWATVVLFALFVYSIVQDLNATTSALKASTTKLETAAKLPPAEITDFSR